MGNKADTEYTECQIHLVKNYNLYSKRDLLCIILGLLGDIKDWERLVDAAINNPDNIDATLDELSYSMAAVNE